MFGNGRLAANCFDPAQTAELPTPELRHYFASYFLRRFMLWTWWIGAIAGAILVFANGGGFTDLPWGVVAGAAAGMALSVTVGSVFLVLDIVPLTIWNLVLSGRGGTIALLALWIVMAVVSWTVSGALIGAILSAIPKLRGYTVLPVHDGFAAICRFCGLRKLT